MGVALALAVGCGPKEETTSGSGNGDTSDESESESGTSEAQTTSSTNPGTTTTASGGTTSAGPSTTNPDPATSSDPSTTGCGFICPTDAAGDSQCDPATQDCPEGEKCTAVSPTEGEPWGVNECKPVNGNAQVGDPCDVEGGKYTGVDNCDVGLICLLTDDEGVGGVCVEFCDSNMSCPVTGADCQVYNNGSLPICLPECNPLIQDCPDGQGCYNGAGGGWVCFKQSAEPGEGQQGNICEYINQCNAGLFCANAVGVAGCPEGASGCCTPFCDLNEPDPNASCQDGEECTAYYEEGQAPPGEENIGICFIPQ